jgi:hypothetical protein
LVFISIVANQEIYPHNLKTLSCTSSDYITKCSETGNIKTTAKKQNYKETATEIFSNIGGSDNNSHYDDNNNNYNNKESI